MKKLRIGIDHGTIPLPSYVLMHLAVKPGFVKQVWVFDQTPEGFAAAKSKAFILGRERGLDLRPGFSKKVFSRDGFCTSPVLDDKTYVTLRPGAAY